jgi:hypothetical protein
LGDLRGVFDYKRFLNKLNKEHFGGDALYMSPDVWEENYTYNSDVW